jgi:menaquinone-dependent protoporphyrinogen oxidase
MKRVLVTYATMAGSTAEVAQAVAEELGKSGLAVDVRPIAEVAALDGYDGVVVGGPMIMGWHRQARAFLKKQRPALQRLPLAVFITCITLTETGERKAGGVPIFVDERLPKAPAVPGRLTFKERYARLANYVRPIVKASRPASIGVFGGRLELGRVPWWAVLFVMLVIQAPAGDKRNWAAIREWAAGLPAAFEWELSPADRQRQLA